MKGRYKTAVNLLNASPTTGDAHISKSVTLSVPQGQTPIMGDVLQDTLPSRGALDIDCVHFAQDFGFQGMKVPGGKGFMIIESDKELDVAAVYTSTMRNKAGVGESIDVEYIDGKWSNQRLRLLPAVPTVERVPSNSHPPIPLGLKVTCLEAPNSDCPVIKWGPYTYWAYSHTDNRTGMTIVAYDSNDNVVDQWVRTGARYIISITLDMNAMTATFLGQASNTIALGLDELNVGQ